MRRGRRRGEHVGRRRPAPALAPIGWDDRTSSRAFQRADKPRAPDESRPTHAAWHAVVLTMPTVVFTAGCYRRTGAAARVVPAGTPRGRAPARAPRRGARRASGRVRRSLGSRRGAQRASRNPCIHRNDGSSWVFWRRVSETASMRMRGLEPPRPYGHTDLNRARLPIPPHPRGRSV